MQKSALLHPRTDLPKFGQPTNPRSPPVVLLQVHGNFIGHNSEFRYREPVAQRARLSARAYRHNPSHLKSVSAYDSSRLKPKELVLSLFLKRSSEKLFSAKCVAHSLTCIYYSWLFLRVMCTTSFRCTRFFRKISDAAVMRSLSLFADFI